MTEHVDRDLGEQPLAVIMISHNLKPHDLVAASREQITHKMVARAVKGRRLTPNTQAKILTAINTVTKRTYLVRDLFNY